MNKLSFRGKDVTGLFDLPLRVYNEIESGDLSFGGILYKVENVMIALREEAQQYQEINKKIIELETRKDLNDKENSELLKAKMNMLTFKSTTASVALGVVMTLIDLHHSYAPEGSKLMSVPEFEKACMIYNNTVSTEL